ncbi:MAG: hypothetical protein OEQ74_04290 [Gammaproteobacteria bacterium]|nr:hypothetical protein [Gammaproteobacteria bacterium]
MQIFLFTFTAFLLAMAGLGAGIFLGRGAPRGSCGGLNLPDGTRIDCGACPKHRQCKRQEHTCDHETGDSPAGAQS